MNRAFLLLCVSLMFADIAAGDTQTWTWKGGTGNWATQSSWAVQGPSSASEIVYLVDGAKAANSTVTLGGNLFTAVSRVEVSAGDQLSLAGTSASTLNLNSQLRVDGTVSMASNLYFPNAGSSITGSGEIRFEQLSGLSSVTCVGTAAAPFVIGNNVLVHGGNGLISGTDLLSQNGTINADVASRLTIVRAFQLNNTGALNASAGTLYVQPTNFYNTGTVTASGTGLVSIEGAWKNSGSFNVKDGGAIELGGKFSDVGVLSRSGANTSVSLTGILDRSASGLPFRLDQTTGSWNFRGGTIKNTRIEFHDGATLIPVPASVARSYLDHTTLGSDWNLPAGSIVYVQNGLVLDHSRIFVQGGTNLAFVHLDAPQTLSGPGEIVFPSSGASGVISLSNTGARALTIAPDVKVHGGNGLITLLSGYGAPGLINRGTIDADVSGTTLQISGETFKNEGRLVASAGTITTDFPFTTSGTIATAGTGRINMDGGLYVEAGAHFEAALDLLDPFSVVAPIKSRFLGLGSTDCFLDLIGGVPGATYAVISADSFTGTPFAHVSPGYQVTYNPTNISVTVLPEPSSMLGVAAIALVSILGVRKRSTVR